MRLIREPGCKGDLGEVETAKLGLGNSASGSANPSQSAPPRRRPARAPNNDALQCSLRDAEIACRRLASGRLQFNRGQRVLYIWTGSDEARHIKLASNEPLAFHICCAGKRSTIDRDAGAQAEADETVAKGYADSACGIVDRRRDKGRPSAMPFL